MSQALSEPVTEGTGEKAYHDGGGTEYDPDTEMTAFEIFHTVEREGREGGEASAEAGHRDHYEGGFRIF